MNTRPHSRGRWGRCLLDLVGYAVGSTAAVVLLTVPVSLAAGRGSVGVKVGLFLAGVAYVGYATVLQWPARPGAGIDDVPNRTVRGDRPTGFGALRDRVPPWKWYDLGSRERFSSETKLYATGALMFGLSFLLEAAFGVRV